MHGKYVNKSINYQNIKDEFSKACASLDEAMIINLFNHESGYLIDLNESRFENLEIIEGISENLLKFVLSKTHDENKRVVINNQYVDVKTYYYALSDGAKNNKEIISHVLLNEQEHLSFVPNKIKTPVFLTELANSNYNANIFDYEFIYGKPYAKFIIDYASKGNSFSKKVRLDEELLHDRDFILELSKTGCNLFPLICEIYRDDKEIILNIATHEINTLEKMSAEIIKEISQSKEMSLKAVSTDATNYILLSKERQLDDDCVSKALSLDTSIYEHLPSQIKDDQKKALEHVLHFNMDASHLSKAVRANYEIAKVMIAKNGINLDEFPLFKDNQEMIELALKSSKRLSHLPKEQRSIAKIKEIMMQAEKYENSFNLQLLLKEMKNKKDRKVELVIDLIKGDKLDKESLATVIYEYGDHIEDRELVKECITKDFNLYGSLKIFNEDYEIAYIYIKKMKESNPKSYKLTLIPKKIKDEAKMHGAGLEQYIFMKALEMKIPQSNADKKIKEKISKI